MVKLLEFHFTPKHGSWLNLAEIEFAALSRQCLDRRLTDKNKLVSDVKAWQEEHNKKAVKPNWSFTIDKAQEKMARQYCKVLNSY